MESLDLVKRFPSSIPCIRLAQINAWNYAFIKCPLMIATLWNKELPKQVKINEDAFIDKGTTPSWLTDEEKKDIAQKLGMELDPMKEGFDPFYQWRFPRPETSPIQEARDRKAMERNRNNNAHDAFGYNQGRYMGD